MGKVLPVSVAIWPGDDNEDVGVTFAVLVFAVVSSEEVTGGCGGFRDIPNEWSTVIWFLVQGQNLTIT